MGDRVGQRVCRRDQIVDVGYGQRPGERFETVGVRRRMVPEHAGKRYLPAFTLQRHGAAAAGPGHRGNNDGALPVTIFGITPVEP